MADKSFVHLHVHTDYSLLDGACQISRLLDQAMRLNMPALAITDHGNLFGAVEFYYEATQRGIRPIIGCEVYIAQGDRRSRSEGDRYNHFVLLAETQEGYKNLLKLVSAGYLEGFYYKPRIDRSLLAQHAKGLIGLSGCLRGDINEMLLAGEYEAAVRRAYEYADIFGPGNFFLEIQHHHMEEDLRLVPQVIQLSRRTGIPLVATNDTHYLTPADSEAHDVLLCIMTGKTITETARLKTWPPHFYLKSHDEMAELFGDLPEAMQATLEIAERCQVAIDKTAAPFPQFDVPPGFTTDTYFEYVVRKGFEARRPRIEAMYAAGRLKHHPAEYEERLDQEIRTIQRMKFSGYFLIVWDFIRFAKSRGIPVGPGRGSAAGSLVSYALGITDIDPLQYGLLFERFLNPERVTLPDIDIDFCMNRRGEVIRYVTEKYGRDRVAQIITFNTLGARAAIKDVGRVLEMSFGEVDRLTKLIPNVHNITLDEALRREPALTEAAHNDPRVARLLELARRVEGLCRNASVHAAGVVITPVPLDEVVPLYKTNRDEIVTQYDGTSLEKLGLLKMDFLGLTTLTIIDDTLELVKKGRGLTLSLQDLPLDDPATFEVFCRAQTSGVFQFESAGMQEILRRYQPSRFEDLIALNALYRPGPIQGGMIDEFIERKHGRKEISYEVPELREILEETYGVIVYQEQVMQIANRLAGYTLGEADLLRRAMGKKKPEEMAAQRERFVRGAEARGVSSVKAGRIFDLVEQFASYGFNKSHSAAYAFLAFVTAYLKAHFPVEFMSALLTSETGNTSKVVKYINECKEMGIEVLPPHVNFSNWNFTPDYTRSEKGSIRFGLGAIKNLGRNTIDAITRARQECGRFRSLRHFCEVVDASSLNRKVIESLIKAGALDGMGLTRAAMWELIDDALEAGQRAQRARSSGQGSLFPPGLEIAGPALEDIEAPAVAEWSIQERLAGEKEVLGFYVTGHPLDQYKEKVLELATHRTMDLDTLEKGTEVVLCGVITTIHRRRNKEGKAWASLQLEDWHGTIELLVFPAAYQRLEDLMAEERVVMVRGTVLPEEGQSPRISINDIVPLEVAHIPEPSLVSIRLTLGRTNPELLAELFRRKPGNTAVRLLLEKSSQFVVTLDVPQRVNADREFVREVERLCGSGAYMVLAH